MLRVQVRGEGGHFVAAKVEVAGCRLEVGGGRKGEGAKSWRGWKLEETEEGDGERIHRTEQTAQEAREYCRNQQNVTGNSRKTEHNNMADLSPLQVRCPPLFSIPHRSRYTNKYRQTNRKIYTERNRIDQGGKSTR